MNNKERESIIERLLKIKALAEQGVGGERSAAERLLNSLMKPSGDQPELTEEEIKKLKAAALMAKGIERKNVYKQIEGK